MRLFGRMARLLKRRLPVFGDVIEIQTPKGLAYAQYTHENPEYGSLIRVLPGTHPSRPTNLTALVEQRERSYCFYSLPSLVREGAVEIVGHEAVPVWAQPFPLFRAWGLDFTKEGVISASWYLWDGEHEWRADALTPDQANLSIVSVWGHAFLVERIVQGWEPKDDLGIPDLAPRNGALAGTGDGDPLHGLGPAPTLPETRPAVRHYLYFPKRSSATQAARRLRSPTITATVQRSGGEPTWLLLVMVPVTTDEDAERMQDRLDQIAAELGGEYDGWETPV